LILAILLAIVAIQLLYFVIVFSRFILEKAPDQSSITNAKGVSVIVCAWNEFDNIFELIPILNTQQYPDYEVIIVDDRSNDGTTEYLKNELLHYPNFRLVTITETPEHLTSKKYALSLGIKMANKELILLTDADCRPSSEHWIAGMAARLGKKQFVLGYSPYNTEEGLLNAFIRFETLFTAWQYFSYALLGLPYMGVGRNLLYRRKMFFDKLGFRNHQRISGGDDDLFVNENATSNNTAICISPNTFMYSEPKHSFADWYTQKKRHLSIGKFYKSKHKYLLGVYSLSHVLVWLLLPLMVLLPAKLQMLMGGIYLFRFILFWVLAAIANYKLAETVRWYALPLMDLLLAIYYATMGWHSVLRFRKNKWR
jgi:glycosyltransferase involved in cell wall biosynthesis